MGGWVWWGHSLRSSGIVFVDRPPGRKSSPQSHYPKTARVGYAGSSVCAGVCGPGSAPIPVWNEEGVWDQVAGAKLEERRLQKEGASVGESSTGTAGRWGPKRSESPSYCFLQRWNMPLETRACFSFLQLLHLPCTQIHAELNVYKKLTVNLSSFTWRNEHLHNTSNTQIKRSHNSHRCTCGFYRRSGFRAKCPNVRQ